MTETLPKLHVADVPAVTRDQMREVDRLMIEEYGIQLLQMMENAGLQLAQLTRHYLDGPLEGRRVAVLVGRGNNGGGGLTAARRLSAWGAEVAVVLADEPEAFRDAPALQLSILQHMGVSARYFSQSLPPHDLLIDALIGYGLEGPPRETANRLISAANASPAPVISLDTPSGLDVDTGEAPGNAIRAMATLTLALPKIGLTLPSAQPYVGALYLADISVPPSLYSQLGIEAPPLFASGPLVMIITKAAAHSTVS